MEDKLSVAENVLRVGWSGGSAYCSIGDQHLVASEVTIMV